MKIKALRSCAAMILVFMLLTGLTQGVLAAGTSASVLSPTIRVGIIKTNGYADEDENGDVSGVNPEYTYKLAQNANINIKIVLITSSKDALTMLDDGRLDMMCNVIKTAERENKYLFSENEIGSLPMCVFVKKDDQQYTYNNVDQLKKMTFGAEESSRVKDLFITWCVQHGFTPNIKMFSSIGDIKVAVNSGLVSAGIYGTPSVEGFRTVQTFSPVPYYYVFRKDSTGLKNKVDEAMTTMLAEDPLYFDKLVSKYTSSIAYDMDALTTEEKSYIQSHPEVTVAVLANDEPYYSLKNGVSGGVMPEFYKKISALTGIKFTYKVYKTQDEAIKAVKNGRADVLAMYSNGQIPANNLGLRLTRAYSNVDTVLVTRAGTSMSSIRTVAVKSRSKNAIKTSLSNILTADYIGYDNAPECFAAVKTNKADAMICGLPSATWLINQNLASAYNIQTLTSDSLELCGATDYSNSVLCSVLGKAIKASSYAFNEIVTNNTLPEDNLGTNITRIPPIRLAVIVVALFIVVLMLVWALVSLQRRHRDKAAVMEQLAENRRRENELAALEKATESKNRFFSNISHDMRTPLNAIIGFSGLAQVKAASPEVKDYLKKIQSSGQLLLELINDTLMISKSNSGKLELRPEPVTIEEIFDSVVIPIRDAAALKKIDFTADCSGAAPRTVLADKLNVQKILLNLLTNAVKYTPEGGRVVFSIRDEDIGSGVPDTVIKVKDTGIGMSEDFIEHIYEPFVQENRTGYESSGTGLGLSIVKQLIDLMGGRIEVRSEKNRGTEFTVRLSLPDADVPAVKSAQKPAPAPYEELAGKTVLLCEDNALNREIACALLNSKGVEVVTAENGSVGVYEFQNSAPGKFAAVLMDIRMPVMNGYEATEKIRALPRGDAVTVPIIAMTADAFEEDIRRGMTAGMTAYLTKPIEPEKLFDVLASYIV